MAPCGAERPVHPWQSSVPVGNVPSAPGDAPARRGEVSCFPGMLPERGERFRRPGECSRCLGNVSSGGKNVSSQQDNVPAAWGMFRSVGWNIRLFWGMFQLLDGTFPNRVEHSSFLREHSPPATEHSPGISPTQGGHAGPPLQSSAILLTAPPLPSPPHPPSSRNGPSPTR
jgi:hypothetical protein